MSITPTTIKDLNGTAHNAIVAAFNGQRFTVAGEVNQLRFSNAGHVAFTLKENSECIGCFTYASDYRKFPFELATGQRIRVTGDPTLYIPARYVSESVFQIQVRAVEPLDLASRLASRERLKEQVHNAGFPHRRSFPRPPSSVGLITSDASRAIEDFMQVLRQQGVAEQIKVILRPTPMQGKDALREIPQAIRELATQQVDVIVITRGGGNDLSVFDAPQVVWAIAKSPVPTVVAIGHAADHPVAENAADVAATTPTAAAWSILPHVPEAEPRRRQKAQHVPTWVYIAAVLLLFILVVIIVGIIVVAMSGSDLLLP